MLVKKSQVSLQKKIQRYVTALICLSVVLFVVVASAFTTSIIRSKVILYSQQLMDQALQNIAFYLTDMENIAKNISFDQEIYNTVSGVNRGSITLAQAQNMISADVKKYQYVKSYITDISIFDEKQNRQYNFNYDYKNNIFEQTWYKNYQKNASDAFTTPIHRSIVRNTSIEGLNTFTFFKKVYDYADSSTYRFTVAIEVDARVVDTALGALESNYGSRNFILNKDGEQMTALSDEKASLFRSISGKVPGNSPKGYCTVSINGEKQIVLFYQSDDSLWKIYSVVRYRDLMWEVQRAILVYALVGTVLAAVGLLLSKRLAESITRPLGVLMVSLKEFEGGNMDVQCNISSGDEISKASDVFNSMVLNIKELIENNRREEKLKHKAELTALQAQIRPHFLYNTLDSINWFAVKKHEYEISDVLTNVGKFFRISLNKGEEFVRVSEELEHVKSYIAIQNFRFANTFSLTMNVPEELYGCYMLKLMLQPIIENCFNHGMKENADLCNIRIEAEKANDLLIFRVMDDGAGIGAEKLAQLKEQLRGEKAGRTGSYGLQNIQDRIRLYFGAAYGIDISSEEGMGTKVTMRVPLLTSPPER